MFGVWGVFSPDGRILRGEKVKLGIGHLKRGV